MKLSNPFATLVALCSLPLLVSMARAQSPEDITKKGAFPWRSLGPSAMSGRVVDIEVHPEDPSLIYVGSASGGVFKTQNRGVTFTPITDALPIFTVGDLALAPSRPDTLYLGTGEANNQRSSYAGDGLWRSDDAGKTWRHVGLEDSHHIGRVVVHPNDPDTVFVACLGHLYSKNEARGLYRTRDGGRHWTRVLTIDEDTGVVDVSLDPKNPNNIVAASYQRRRRAFDFQESGPGSSIWRSTDGGETFARAKGIPRGEIGRIGLTRHPVETNVLYCCVENRNERQNSGAIVAPSADEDAEGDAETRDESHASPDGELTETPQRALAEVGGEVYRSDDGGASFTRVNEKSVSGEPAYYYGQLRVDPTNTERLWLLGVSLYFSEDGGKTWKSDGARGVHVDHHALWINPKRPDHMLLGNDGGLCQTYDRGRTWEVFPNLVLGQFYAVAVDDSEPYRVLGGLQDNGSHLTPSVGSTSEGINVHETARVNGGDGFYVGFDPTDPDVVYAESQFGRPSRIDLRTGERTGIRPPAERGEPAQRFNWSTPLIVSSHDPRTLYLGSQRVYRSRDRGDTWKPLSDDLTTNDAAKLLGDVPHCTLTTLAESPVKPEILWAGTDDGKVWVSQDDGRHWRDVSDHFPAQVRGLWVSRVVASPHDRAVAYVSFTGYREDHFEPYLFMTDDYGGNWTSLSKGLPKSPINVVREDSVRKGLLFVGTEEGVYVSLDNGDRWHRLDDGLPRATPVHDLALQEREGELIAGTHGRGLFVLDYSPLRTVPGDKPVLCKPKVHSALPTGFAAPYQGARRFVANNPAPAVVLRYYLNAGETDVSLLIEDAAGQRVASLNAKTTPGLNRSEWSLRPGRGAPNVGGQRGRTLRPGHYVAVLTVGKESVREVFEVKTAPPPPTRPEEDEEEEMSGVR